jgi:hypothetical protein
MKEGEGKVQLELSQGDLTLASLNKVSEVHYVGESGGNDTT